MSIKKKKSSQRIIIFGIDNDLWWSCHTPQIDEIAFFLFLFLLFLILKWKFFFSRPIFQLLLFLSQMKLTVFRMRNSRHRKNGKDNWQAILNKKITNFSRKFRWNSINIVGHLIHRFGAFYSFSNSVLYISRRKKNPALSLKRHQEWNYVHQFHLIESPQSSCQPTHHKPILFRTVWKLLELIIGSVTLTRERVREKERCALSASKIFFLRIFIPTFSIKKSIWTNDTKSVSVIRTEKAKIILSNLQVKKPTKSSSMLMPFIIHTKLVLLDLCYVFFFVILLSLSIVN